MAKTNAEYQRDHRQRQLDRIAELEAEAGSLRALLAEVDARAESAEAVLAKTNAEIERLSAAQCKHPSAVVEGGTCRACGSEIW